MCSISEIAKSCKSPVAPPSHTLSSPTYSISPSPHALLALSSPSPHALLTLSSPTSLSLFSPSPLPLLTLSVPHFCAHPPIFPSHTLSSPTSRSLAHHLICFTLFCSPSLYFLLTLSQNVLYISHPLLTL